MGFPGGTSGKAFTCQCRRCKRCRLDPWGQERYPGVGNGNSLQYSCLENPLDREEPGWGYKESDMTETKHKLKGTNAFNVSSTLQRVIILNANLTLQLTCLFSVAESLHLLKIFIYLFGCAKSELQRVISSVSAAAYRICFYFQHGVVACKV